MRYIYHLDNIRVKKNITVAQLVDGICSERQYRKYLSGDNNISDKRILEFCENLSINSKDFYYSLADKDQADRDKIREVFYAIGAKDLDRAGRLLDIAKQIKNLTNFNKKYLDYCIIRFEYQSGNIYPEEAIDRLQKLINYPDSYYNEAFDMVDVMIILKFTDIQTRKTKKDDHVDFLLQIINNTDKLFISSEERQYMPLIYSNACRALGVKGRFEEAIEYAKIGAKYCLRWNYTDVLDDMYFFASLGNKLIGNMQEAEKYAALTMHACYALKTPDHIKRYYNMLKNEFNKDPFIFMEESKLDFMNPESDFYKKKEN